MITIRVLWQPPYSDSKEWNELCAWAIERFGMPNTERYKWNARRDYMDFTFSDEQDALMFQLYCGYGERVDTNQLTTEYFSKCL